MNRSRCLQMFLKVGVPQNIHKETPVSKSPFIKVEGHGAFLETNRPKLCRNVPFHKISRPGNQVKLGYFT